MSDSNSYVSTWGQYAKVVIEILILIFKILIEIIKATLKLIIPATEKSVKGDIILVTGAGHGLGKELALQYAALDALVVCLDINAQTNNDTVAEIKKMNKTGFGYTCDITKQDEVLKTLRDIQEDIGDIGILVNNAGVIQAKPFLKFTTGEIQKIFDVNVMSHFLILQAVLPTMIKNNYGHIVTISSGMGLIGLQYFAPYSSSKHAVLGLINSVKEELRQCPNNNIKFTTILPSVMDTGFFTNYSVRFPLISDPVPVSKAAQLVIRSQRKEISEVSTPTFILPLLRFANFCMPDTVKDLVMDIFDIKINF